MTTRDDDRELWLSEAASMTGVPAVELRRAVGRGELDAVCPSGDKRAIRLRFSDLSKWMAGASPTEDAKVTRENRASITRDDRQRP